MGRLIDADELIESFEPHHDCDWYTPWIVEKINNQPTAFNVEAVVKELRVLKMRHYLTMANTGSEALDFAYIHVGSAIDKAIEIVKGGVE